MVAKGISQRGRRAVRVGLAVLIGLFLLLMPTCPSAAQGAPPAPDPERPPLIVGSGRVVVEERDATGVRTVTMRALGTIYVTQGDEERLRVEAEENLQRHIRTLVLGDRLEIGTAAGVELKPTRPIEIYLTARELDSVRLFGRGSVVAAAIASDRLAIYSEGSGLLKVRSVDGELVGVVNEGSGRVEIGKLRARKVLLSDEGSGDLTVGRIETTFLDVRVGGPGWVRVLGGSAVRQDVEVTGAGGYAGSSFSSQEANVLSKGSGPVLLLATHRLKANLIGTGDVFYSGRPQVELSAKGTGRLISW